MAAQQTQELDAEAMRKFCKERGIGYLPDQPDHWIYKRGRVVVFRNSPDRSSGSTPTSPEIGAGQNSAA